jgi:hypothetical protein
MALPFLDSVSGSLWSFTHSSHQTVDTQNHFARKGIGIIIIYGSELDELFFQINFTQKEMEALLCNLKKAPRWPLLLFFYY